jgi:hypothetical protein
MAKTYLTGSKGAAVTRNPNPAKRKRRFKDPRLRWMDEVLLSFKKPAPESWVPASYRYLFQQRKKPTRPIH